MKQIPKIIVLLFVPSRWSRPLTRLKPVALFDGKTLAGWEGNKKHFRIEDNAIVGGSLKEKIPRNEFLMTTKEYGDFELKLEIKLLGKGANAGRPSNSTAAASPITTRSAVIKRTWATAGGVASDDESRRNKKLAGPDAKEAEANREVRRLELLPNPCEKAGFAFG